MLPQKGIILVRALPQLDLLCTISMQAQHMGIVRRIIRAPQPNMFFCSTSTGWILAWRLDGVGGSEVECVVSSQD